MSWISVESRDKLCAELILNEEDTNKLIEDTVRSIKEGGNEMKLECMVCGKYFDGYEDDLACPTCTKALEG